MLQNKQYVPFLKTGIAEIDAFRALFPDVKDALFPIFAARPWPRAKHFQFTVDRVREAVDGHAFGFGLDPSRRNHSNPRPAQNEFDALFNEHRGFLAYYEFIETIRGAVPVLIPTSSSDTMLLQIGNADTLNRGLIIHQRRESPIPISDAILNLPPLPQDTVIVIDAGWSKDYLAQESWTLSTTQRMHAALPQAEIVVMSSSFPDSFNHIVGNAEELANERRLFSAMRQRFNLADMTYGDWGSTRPSQGGGGGTIPSRVDISKLNSWEIFRADPDNDPGFHEVAWEAQHHPCFRTTPDCWGKQTIAVTDDEGSGITGRQVATAVRINIHMTIQSGSSSILPTDEVPYED